MSQAFDQLSQFIETQMQMQHIYQPVMLEVLLARGGVASVRDVAKAILPHDESQLEYYEQIVKRMPGKVLASHGLVTRRRDEYALAPEHATLADNERAELIRLCRVAVEQHKEKRGTALWQHRAMPPGVIPGRVRYETLKRANFRCELCGVSADERALDVDHILPRSQGGSDDAANLQALCWLCNTNKGAGDSTDFRGTRDSYAMRDSGCVFCTLGERAVVVENVLAVLIEDGFPVTPGHLLAIPRRHVADFFDLYQPERNALNQLLDAGRRHLMSRDASVTGFNIGINAGAAAGQTIPHCHVHLIPRRVGDVEDPRGGVRGVMPGKAAY